MQYHIEKIKNGWLVRAGLANRPGSPLYFGEQVFCAKAVDVADLVGKILAQAEEQTPPTEPAQQ